MKTLITPVALLLSAMPFAFFKMDKDPWYQGYHFNLNNRQEGTAFGINQLSEEAYPGLAMINYLFLYNKETGYAIACSDMGGYFFNKKSKEYTDFFQCTRKPSFSEKDPLSFIFIEEISNLKEEYLQFRLQTKRDEMRKDKIKSEVKEETKNLLKRGLSFFKKKWFENFDNLQSSSQRTSLNGSLLFADNSHLNKSINREGFHESLMLEFNEDFKKDRVKKLSREFRSESGVYIDNEECRIIISKRKIAKDFQKSLCHYFETHNRDIKFATDIAKGEGISARLLNNLQFAPFNEELSLLNSSNILAVFGVFKGKSGNESIVWGMAEDKDSKEIFYWITDLEADISVLTQ